MDYEKLWNDLPEKIEEMFKTDYRELTYATYKDYGMTVSLTNSIAKNIRSLMTKMEAGPLVTEQDFIGSLIKSRLEELEIDNARVLVTFKHTQSPIVGLVRQVQDKSFLMLTDEVSMPFCMIDNVSTIKVVG